MNWIKIEDESELPRYKTIIVEDENNWMGQAFFNDSIGRWQLETFSQTNPVFFDKIERYFIVPD